MALLVSHRNLPLGITVTDLAQSFLSAGFFTMSSDGMMMIDMICGYVYFR